jgi:hypothetical protein
MTGCILGPRLSNMTGTMTVVLVFDCFSNDFGCRRCDDSSICAGKYSGRGSYINHTLAGHVDFCRTGVGGGNRSSKSRICISRGSLGLIGRSVNRLVLKSEIV